MKICLAQTQPVTGNVDANISKHLRQINVATAHKTDLILFPELSITGYEPMLAKNLATTIHDERFNLFQKCSDEAGITIGIGVPLKNGEGIIISLLLFSPAKERQIYSKHYLHKDEEPFFSSGENTSPLGVKTALAICYELSVPAHAENALQAGAEIYLASVAKTAKGMGKAAERMQQIANDYSIPTMMVNCIGVNDGVLCAGRTAAWDKEGRLLGQLDDKTESLLLVDTIAGTARELH